MSVKAKDQELLKLNKLIADGLFDDAISYVNELTLSSPVKNFNVGYIMFNQKQYVEARVFLERAQFGGMLSKETDDALSLVKEKLEITAIENEFSRTDDFILNSASLPAETIPAIALLGCVIFLISAWKKRFFPLVLSVMSLMTVCFVYYSVKDLEVKFNQEDNIVYRGPSRIFEELQVLPKGVKFITSKESQDWTFIKYPAMYSGWIYKNKAIKL
ncbi:MAG: hypothetical protein HON90_14715 [Halobacteriovoraceae bacterium]|jgi:hypothetical protein|nr:hypothetical protein [Halobacteriovoraceae bacterium]